MNLLVLAVVSYLRFSMRPPDCQSSILRAFVNPIDFSKKANNKQKNKTKLVNIIVLHPVPLDEA